MNKVPFLVLIGLGLFTVVYANSEPLWYNSSILNGNSEYDLTSSNAISQNLAIASHNTQIVATPVAMTNRQAETPLVGNSNGVFVGETCVTGVRKLGANVPKGDAIDLPVGATPQAGGVVKLKYGEGRDKHHVVVILAILKTGYWTGGYNKNGKGEYQEYFIPFNSESIIGFWSP